MGFLQRSESSIYRNEIPEEMSVLINALCYCLIFFSIAQPGILFPAIDQFTKIFFTLSLLTAALFFSRKMSLGQKSTKLAQNKFIYAILAAYTLSEAQYLWLSGTLTVFLFWFKKVLLFYLTVNIARELVDLRRMMWAVMVATMVLSILGWDLYCNSPQLLHDAGRLQSLGNYNLSNSFAMLLTATFPLSFAVLEVEKNPAKRIFIVFALCLFVVSCIYTKSRGGAMGMLIAISICFMGSRVLVRGKALKTCVIAVVFSCFLLYGVTVILSRSDVTGYFGEGGEASSGDRLMAWVAGVKMFASHPLFGVGWEKFREESLNYGMDKRLLAHNTMLSVLAETGIFGFTCFMAIIYYSLKQLWSMRIYWKVDNSRTEHLILSQGIFISFVCFLINTSFSVKDHDPMYWAILGLTGVACKLFQEERKALAERETLARAT